MYQLGVLALLQRSPPRDRGGLQGRALVPRRIRRVAWREPAAQDPRTRELVAAMKLSLALAALMACASAVRAEIPDSYKPLVVEPPFSFTERVFDLTAAVARAQSE